MRVRAAFLLFCWCLRLTAAQTDCAVSIASPINPAKLAKLGTRETNSRVLKCVCWLATDRKEGQQPEKLLDAAVADRIR